MNKNFLVGLLSGLLVLIFIIIFTNIVGVDPSTVYINLIEDTIIRKYNLDILLATFIILAIVFFFNNSKKN